MTSPPPFPPGSSSREVVFDELFLRQLETLADLLGKRERLRIALKQLDRFKNHPNYPAWQASAARALASYDRKITQLVGSITMGVYS